MLEPTKALREITQKALSLNEDDAFSFVFTIKKNQDLVIELNTNSQLFEQGIDATGTELTPLYTPITEFIKIQKRQRIDHVTLFDTGEFYGSFRVNVNNNGTFDITADTQKDDDNLEDKYGDEIIGLTDESLDFLSEYIVEDLIQYIRRTLDI